MNRLINLTLCCTEINSQTVEMVRNKMGGLFLF